MSADYNTQVAFHYSSYRPPLHAIILSKVLEQQEHFNSALDIGCGTGKSSEPLIKYCKEVIAIDPSQTMINQAKKIPSITYICSNEDTLAQFQSKKFDLVTFAGSLFYAKNEKLRNELKRICKENASVIIYDFEVMLSDLLPAIKLNLSKLNSNEYDHSLNLSDWTEFNAEIVCKEQIGLTPTAEELAHLILAHSTWHKELANQYKDIDPFIQLVNYLKSSKKEFNLTVNIFYSRYHQS